MNETSALEYLNALNHLNYYTSERLPYLAQGGLENPDDDLSFTTDTRYRLLQDPAS